MTRFSLSALKPINRLTLLRQMILMLGLCASVPMNAQGGPVRDASAIAVLQNSVSAMGGSNGWSGMQDWTVTGTVTITGSSQQAANFSWIGAGSEFRLEIDNGQSTFLFLSGHGTPARIMSGEVSPISYFVARANPPLYLPGIRLIQELDNAQLTIQYVGQATVHGVPAVQVHVSDDSDQTGSLVTPHDWYFDASSFLPLQVQFRLPSNENASDYLNGAFDFWQFQSVNGLVVPSQLSLSKDSSPTKTFVVGTTAFNSGIPQSEFDPPQGGGQ